MNILMISATFPYPPSLGGTPIRTFNLLKYLSQHHQVTLVVQRSQSVDDEDIHQLRRHVQELVVFPRPDPNSTRGGKVRRFAQFALTGTPPHVRAVASAPMQAWIDDWVAAGKVDVITCEHSVNEVFIRSTYRRRVPRLVLDIHSSLYGTLANQLRTKTAEKPLRDLLSLPLMRRYERRYSRKFTNLVVTTREDLGFFTPRPRQAAMHVVPNGVDLAEFPLRATDPGGYALVFVGAMDYIANVDTAQYLVQEIMPLLRQRYPQASLSLVGGNPTPAVQALGQLPGITVTGRVPSVVPHLHQATVAVIPMRIGFGIKNKTLEAMAAGVPVVASDRGLEGLASDEPPAALRANTTVDYVNAIGKLFDNADLRAEIARNAHHLVAAHFTWEAVGQQYNQILTG